MDTKWLPLLLVALVSNSFTPARGAILSGTNYTLDLTDADAHKKVEWSDPDRITVSPQGLGFGKPGENASRDFWLETEPFAIGYSWRPASNASINTTIRGSGTSGMVYGRYSADGTHWTAWQYLGTAGSSPREVVLHAALRVPSREKARYHDLRLNYSRRDDVPWRSDEEALVRDILKAEPKFFERSTPFIGYVQLLYEASLYAGQRIEAIDVQVGWVLDGHAYPPKDASAEKGRDVPWRFKVEDDKPAAR